MQISQYAVDRIIEFEVSSRAYYEKNYQHLEWPGLSSGPTGGIGYDFGQASATKIKRDWSGILPAADVEILASCSGYTGEAGRRKTKEIGKRIKITWDQAARVFLESDVPEWTKAVLDRVPGAEKLPPDCLGAEVSVAYNRGAAFNNGGDRYREMRQIKIDTSDRKLWGRVPDHFRSMKRLWPNTRGLCDRREVEAKMFERGLASGVPPSPPAKPKATETPNKTMPPKPPGASEHSGAAMGAGAAAEAAHQGGLFNLPMWEVALVALGIIGLGAAIWFGIRAYRKSQPTLARAKS